MNTFLADVNSLVAQIDLYYWPILATVGGAFFLISTLARFYLYSRGKATFRDELSPLSMWGLIILTVKNAFSRDCFTARRLFNQSIFRGLNLVLVIWGTLSLFLGATVFVLNQNYGITQLEIPADIADTFWLDISAALVFIGLVAMVIRRFFSKSVRDLTSREDMVLISLFLLLLVQGFTVKGLTMGGQNPLENSPVAWSFGQLFLGVIQGSASVETVDSWLLRIHELTVVIFVAYIPYSKMFHLFASPITTRIASKRYGGYAGDRGTRAPGILNNSQEHHAGRQSRRYRRNSDN